MHTTIAPYLTFSGNCREAMLFYQKCLGGELFLQTVADTKTYKKMPRKMRESVIHATLVRDTFALMGSDIVDEDGLVKGNSMAISLICSDKSGIERCFIELSKGGRTISPLGKTKYGNYFGSLIDKFGNQWLLIYNTKRKQILSKYHEMTR